MSTLACALSDVGLGDPALFLGRAVDGLLIGELGLVLLPLGHFERIRHLVEPLQRRVAGAGELLDAVVGALGEGEIRFRRFVFRLALGDRLGPRPGEDVGELGLGDVDAGLGLTPFGDELRVVDFIQQLPRRDVLSPFDGTLADPAVDSRGDVDAGGVGFALDDQRLGLCGI